MDNAIQMFTSTVFSETVELAWQLMMENQTRLSRKRTLLMVTYYIDRLPRFENLQYYLHQNFGISYEMISNQNFVVYAGRTSATTDMKKETMKSIFTFWCHMFQQEASLRKRFLPKLLRHLFFIFRTIPTTNIYLQIYLKVRF